MPSLCIDWVGTHAPLYRAIGGLVLDVPDNFRLNPLLLGRDSGPATRTDEIVEAMRFGSEAPVTPYQSGELRRIILKAYEERGILESDRATWTREAPKWQDLIDIVEGNLKGGHYEGTQKESVFSIREKLYLIESLVGEEPAYIWDIVKKVPTCLNMSPLLTADSRKAVVTYHVVQRIYHEFFAQRLKQAGPFLRMMVIIDEAHILLGQKESDTGTTKQESILLHVIRLGRQFGWSMLFASQLMTDIPEEFAGNAATFIAFLHGTDMQKNRVIKQFSLSPPEEKMYHRLPRGACFIRRLGQDYADLVKIQMLSEEEIEAARELSRSIKLPQLAPPRRETPRDARPEERKTPPRVTRIDIPKLEEHEEEEAPATPAPRHCASCQQELSTVARFCDRCGTPQQPHVHALPETALTTPAKPSPAVPDEPAAEGGEGAPPELSSDETRILRALMIAPLNMRCLLEKFPAISYKGMLKKLHALQDEKLVRLERVPDFEGKNIPHYGALLAGYQSLGILHRVMLHMLVDATVQLRPIPNMQSRPDAPDIVWEKAAPKTAGEVETGLKNLTPSELQEWGKNAKERAAEEFRCERVIVFVPNVGIQKLYEQTCCENGLALVTMENALQLLKDLGFLPDPVHNTEPPKVETNGKSHENLLVEYLKRTDGVGRRD
jgi:hypothetical protein